MFVCGPNNRHVTSKEGSRLLQDGFHPQPPNFFATLQPNKRKIITRYNQNDEIRTETVRELLRQYGF